MVPRGVGDLVVAVAARIDLIVWSGDSGLRNGQMLPLWVIPVLDRGDLPCAVAAMALPPGRVRCARDLRPGGFSPARLRAFRGVAGGSACVGPLSLNRVGLRRAGCVLRDGFNSYG